MTRKDFLKCACSLAGLSLLDLNLSNTASALLEPDAYPALYWKLEKDAIKCGLCPHGCIINKGKRGFCRVRQNNSGKLYTYAYSRVAAVHVDPIEKKPLFHFLPGTTAFSICTAGCNLRCKFCQNWEISQSSPEEAGFTYLIPPKVQEGAKETNSKTVAYTYTEPTIFYEYMLDSIKLAKPQGLKNIIKSAGFFNEEPLKELCRYIDAANIDLKAFTESYYQDICSARLHEVLRTLKIIKAQNVHLEITNLIVPTLNDNPKEITDMCKWISDNLGQDVPLHFSRFWPMYKLTNLSSTPVSTLEMARGIALKAGLRYVYIGNVPTKTGETTFCPKCGRSVIVRSGYIVLENNLSSGSCKFCKEKIAGVWN